MTTWAATDEHAGICILRNWRRPELHHLGHRQRLHGHCQVCTPLPSLSTPSLTLPLSAITAVIVTIFDLIMDIICCRCFTGRRRVGTRRRFGGSRATATY